MAAVLLLRGVLLLINQPPFNLPNHFSCYRAKARTRRREKKARGSRSWTQTRRGTLTYNVYVFKNSCTRTLDAHTGRAHWTRKLLSHSSCFHRKSDWPTRSALMRSVARYTTATFMLHLPLVTHYADCDCLQRLEDEKRKLEEELHHQEQVCTHLCTRTHTFMYTPVLFFIHALTILFKMLSFSFDKGAQGERGRDQAEARRRGEASAWGKGRGRTQTPRGGMLLIHTHTPAPILCVHTFTRRHL